MNKEILLRRLSIIKLLFRSGLEQSQQSDSISFLSILSFHDSIEMFLKLACEYKQIKSEKFSFIEYWDHLPHLTLKESMRNLNARRVNLKHKGLVPAVIEVEASKINTIDFFEQNSKSTFGIEFSEISLLNLIKFEKTRNSLKLSQEEINTNNFKESIKNSLIAFDELLKDYKENKIGIWKKNLFNFPDEIRMSRSINSRKNENKDNRLDDILKMINNKFTHLEKTLEIISLGFDFRKYSKFKLINSSFYKTSTGEYIFYGSEKEEIHFNYKNSNFCLDFVLECSLKLQDFDYENPNIIRF